MKRKRLTAEGLRRLKVPEVLIAGMLAAATLGWAGWKTLDAKRYAELRFPETGVVRVVEDGDTFELQGGKRVRLVGVNAPGRGEKGYEEAAKKVTELALGKRVYLEYDRYQDDKFGRTMAWVWLGCESSPKFTASDYMRLTYNRSREGLRENPEGCKRGKLVQEELVKLDLAKVEVYKDRGELKYEERLKTGAGE